jgi:hypothetical protein
MSNIRCSSRKRSSEEEKEEGFTPRAPRAQRAQRVVVQMIDHSKGIGNIVVNLQALELVARRIVSELEGTNGSPPPGARPLSEVCAGDSVPETALTNFDTLGEVLKKCNKLFEKNGDPYRVDTALVRLRDAIAHGRVMAKDNPNAPNRLYKFSRPKEGMVKVEFAQELSEEWLQSMVERLFNETTGLMEAAKRMGLTCFP